MKHLGLAVCLLFGFVSGGPAAEHDDVYLWPLYRNVSQGERTDVEVLWPILDVKRSLAEDDYRILAVNSYQRDHEADRTIWSVLWPLARLELGKGGKLAGRIVPLFFGRDGQRKHLVLFPEFWYIYRNPEDYVVALLPWARWKNHRDYANVMLPLVWARDNEQRMGALAPISFWRVKSRDDYTAFLFPVFRHLDEASSESTIAVLPWWFARKGEKESGNLLPVLWKKIGDEYKYFVVLPLYYDIEDRKVLLPFYYDLKDFYLILPVYGKGKLNDVEWQTILPPTYLRWTKGEYTEQGIFWPLTQWGEGPDMTRRAMRPFYDYLRMGDYEQHRLLLGLVAHGRGKDRELDRLLPIFSRSRKGERVRSSVLSLFPIGLFRLVGGRGLTVANLFWTGRDSNQRTHGLFPAYSHYEDATTTRTRLFDPLAAIDTREIQFSEFPLYLFEAEHEMSRERPDEPDHHPYEFRTLQTPFWLFKRRHFDTTYMGKGDTLILGTGLTFFLSNWEKDGSPYRQLHLLSAFWDINKGHEHSQGLWPIYTYRTSGSGGTNLSLLDPLWFWGMATGEEEHVSALLKILDYRRWPNGDSRFSVLWRGYRREVDGDRVSGEAFPFLAWERSPERRRFSFIWKMFAYESGPQGTKASLFFVPIK